MPWFKIDDAFHAHPKVRRAGNAAVGLWIRCATYSAQYLTDGHIAPETAREYGTTKEVERLIASRLWLPNGDGFVMPDYLDYNPSAEEVNARRADSIAIRRAGGIARARTGHRDPDTGKFT